MLYSNTWYTSTSLEDIKKELFHRYLYSRKIKKGVRLYMRVSTNRQAAGWTIIDVALSEENERTKVSYFAHPPYFIIANALLFLAANLMVWILCALGRAPFKFCAMFSTFYILIFGTVFWQVKECVKRFETVIFKIAAKCE